LPEKKDANRSATAKSVVRVSDVLTARRQASPLGRGQEAVSPPDRVRAIIQIYVTGEELERAARHAHDEAAVAACGIANPEDRIGVMTTPFPVIVPFPPSGGLVEHRRGLAVTLVAEADGMREQRGYKISRYAVFQAMCYRAHVS
jgi:hypothetical protein